MNNSGEDRNDRVIPPSEGGDEEALKEYGRQLAMDSLLRDLHGAEAAGGIVEFPAKNWNRRAWLSASVAAMAGFAVWKFGQGSGPGGEHLAALDPRWILNAAAGAEYRILGANHIELLRGELRLTSLEPAKLLVETPFAKATANGTDFFIGSHDPEPPNPETNKMKKNTLTRLLVLAGSVTLATSQGEETAKANEAVVAKADQPPEKILVNANTEFAFDFYARLAAAKGDGNLFFSPYSISNALLMVAEGARGETALEMGKVLGFPESLLRYGKDAQKIPWEMSVMRAGQSRLNQLIEGKESLSPEQAKLREKETEMLKKWEKLKILVEEARESDDFEKQMRASNDESRLVHDLNQLRKKMNTITLRMANAVWGDRTANFLEPWKKTVGETYGTGAVREVDFVNDFESERKRINTWVEDQTEDRIKNLLPEDSLNSETRLVLANAIYFKGDWLEPFSEKRTTEGTFTLTSGDAVKASLMKKNSDDSARYAAFNADGSLFATPKTIPFEGGKSQTYPGKDGFSMVEMPYRGGEVSMVMIAPNDPAGLPKIEKNLKASNVSKWIADLKQRKTHVILPKFKMETSYSLSGILAEMGMPTAFDRNEANFTGMSAGEDLYIGAAFHKAFIEVNEKGTEAAAATGMVIPTVGIQRSVPFIPTFQADRPFIYLIRDQKSGAILFLGRVLNPGS